MPKNYTKEELENGRWVTMNGAHIFIKEGESPEDVFNRALNGQPTKKKEPEFGKPGVYSLYRVGKIDFGKKNYRISFAQDRNYANTYSSTPSHKGMEVEEYEVDIKNPLIIDVKAQETKDYKGEKGWMQSEQDGTYAAYNKLFGTNYSSQQDSIYEHGPFYDYAKYGSAKAVKMLRQRDQEIMDEAVKQGYDAVIYKFDKLGTVRNGVRLSVPDNKNEVLIPSEYKMRIKKKR